MAGFLHIFPKQTKRTETGSIVAAGLEAAFAGEAAVDSPAVMAVDAVRVVGEQQRLGQALKPRGLGKALTAGRISNLDSLQSS